MMEPAGEVGWGHVEESIHNYPMTDGDFSREGKVTSSDLSLTGKPWLQCGAGIISPGCTLESHGEF